MTPERRPSAGAFALVFGIACGMSALPATAQNLLDNGDFDDIQQGAGWSLLQGQSLAWLSADRNLCPDSGELQLFVSPILSPELGAYTAYTWSDCIALPAGVTVLQMSFDWTDNTSTSAGVVRFPDAGCADVPFFTGDVANGSDGTWNHFESELDVTGSQSIRVEIGFDGADFFNLIFDRVYVGVRQAIFLDNFGGGSPCRWTSTEP